MQLLPCLFQSSEVHSFLAEEVFPPGTKYSVPFCYSVISEMRQSTYAEAGIPRKRTIEYWDIVGTLSSAKGVGTGQMIFVKRQ